MSSEHIEGREGVYYVPGTRISLDSVVHAFNEGQSHEAIQQDFPLLKEWQIYGAIAFYLDHQAEIDQHLEETHRWFERGGIPMAEANPALWDKIQRARAKMCEPRS